MFPPSKEPSPEPLASTAIPSIGLSLLDISSLHDYWLYLGPAAIASPSTVSSTLAMAPFGQSRGTIVWHKRNTGMLQVGVGALRIRNQFDSSSEAPAAPKANSVNQIVGNLFQEVN